MLGVLQSVIKKPGKIVVILVVSFTLVGLLSASGIIRQWDTVLYDLCINSRVMSDSVTKSQFIATIILDDDSIEALGDQLDSREAYADIINVLSRSNASDINSRSNAAIVMDFMFRHDKQNNVAFAGEVELAGNTVIAVTAVDKDIMKKEQELSPAERQLLDRCVWKNIKVIEKGEIPEAGTFLLPFSSLIEAARAIGHVNADPDNDGVYRRIPLLYKWEDGYIPSLGLAAAVLRLRIDPVANPEAIELKAGAYLSLYRSETDVIRIPIDRKGQMLIPFTETYKDDESGIPFRKVVEAKNNNDAFNEISNDLGGLITLLAEISTSQKDYGPTSFEKLYPLSRVHFEVIGGILDHYYQERKFISWVFLPFKIITMILFVAFAFLFLSIRRDALFHICFLLTLLAFTGLTIIRWQNAAISPWYAVPVSLLFLLWSSMFLNRLFIRYREQLLLHNALSRYFPHALAERIMREGKTELKPAYKELTILFSDISGFTKWSSDKKPEDVHNFLSDYLESMAGILFTHGGTVDKFMGDGILSFFGDPYDIINHTEQCVKAAIAMQEKIRNLAEKWKPIVDIDLKVRVGINTGKVIVGNLGSKTRIEYTVIGAAVNLAQRMESNAPIGGILVTAAVMEKVKDKFNFPERRDVTVKGYGDTIEAYVVEQNAYLTIFDR